MTEYHEAFWLTAGAVAPVIGLAHVVNIGAYIRGLTEITRRRWELTDIFARATIEVLTAGDTELAERLAEESETNKVRTDIDRALEAAKNVERATQAGFVAAAVAFAAALVAMALTLKTDTVPVWSVLILEVLSLCALGVPPAASRKLRLADLGITGAIADCQQVFIELARREFERRTDDRRVRPRPAPGARKVTEQPPSG